MSLKKRKSSSKRARPKSNSATIDEIQSLRKWQGAVPPTRPPKTSTREVKPDLRRGVPSGLMIKADKRATDPNREYGFAVKNSVKEIDCPMKVPEFDRVKHLISWGYDLGKPILVSMSPREFLDMVPPERMPEVTKFKLPPIKKGIKSGAEFEQIPFIDTRNDRVVGHEGRHRAMALQSIGANEMPVLIYQREYRDEDWKKWESEEVIQQVKDVRGW
jgi:hypothetical protein